MVEIVKAGEEAKFDIWSSIHMEKEKKRPKSEELSQPYLPLLRRWSSNLMSQQSLDLCTESLGSETGSDGFFSMNEFDSYFSSKKDSYDEKEEMNLAAEMQGRWKELTTVNNQYCSIGRASSSPRSFPPRLSSSCIQMRPFRRDGRLVLEAVSVPSHSYLHAERHSGRLVLSFADTNFQSNTRILSQEEKQLKFTEEDEEEDDDVVEEEEEVQVVDRGTMVEVKVSTQPQKVNGKATVKVLRSSLVINKFVVGTPLVDTDKPTAAVGAKRLYPTTTTAALVAAAAAGTSTSDGFHYNYLQPLHHRPWGLQTPAAAATAEAKLLFRSRRRSREDMLRDMSRCIELRRPLFIFEQPFCIATTS